MDGHSPISDLKVIRQDATQSSFSQFVGHYMGLIGAFLLITGLCVSAIMMSVGVIVVSCQVLFPQNWSGLKHNVKRQPIFWLMVAYYLAPFTALLFTQDVSKLLQHQQTLLPLLVLPIGFLTRPLFTPRQQRIVIDNLVTIVFITGLLSFIHYLANYEVLRQQLSDGKVIPIVTSINHIYYSIVLAFAAVVGIIRFLTQQQWRPWWKWTFLAMTLANVAFLHFFTTRTGLGGFYLASGLLIFIRFIKNQQKAYAFGGLAGLVLMGISAIAFVPTLQTQYQETKEDLNVYLKDKNPNYYSLTTRLKGWENTWYVIKQNPIIGVGAGQFSAAVDSAYEERGTLLIPKNRVGPHNQYLERTAQSGIPGILTLTSILFWPMILLLKKQYSATALGLLAIVSFAFLAESVLERQTGVTFFAFFWPWMFYQLQKGIGEPFFDDHESDSP